MKPSKNIYGIPFVGKIKVSPAPFHYSIGIENAVDFDLKVGTPILASFDGIVEEVIDGFEKGKHDKRYVHKCNVVMIKHDNGEHSAYAHLLKGIAVKVQQEVTIGQIIGYCGLSGYTSYPHLHYMTGIYKRGDFITLPTRFLIDNQVKILVSPRK